MIVRAGGGRGAVARAIAAAAVCAACTGKPRTDEPAPALVAPGDAARSADAAGADAAGADAAGSAAGRPSGTGDLQIRVEWQDVPVVARSSPGRTPCNTPRAPMVAPTTTWGVPDALVIVDGAASVLGQARTTLADCALAPRIAVGTSLTITSAVDRPAKLTLRKRGPLAQLVAGEPIAVQLPIAGHTVTTALDAGAIYTLETDASEPELAFIAAVPGAYVTEANGQLTVAGLTAGPHAVTAWLPPRAGQPARTGRATATVVASELAELTIRLAP